MFDRSAVLIGRLGLRRLGGRRRFRLPARRECRLGLRRGLARRRRPCRVVALPNRMQLAGRRLRSGARLGGRRPSVAGTATTRRRRQNHHDEPGKHPRQATAAHDLTLPTTRHRRPGSGTTKDAGDAGDAGDEVRID